MKTIKKINHAVVLMVIAAALIFTVSCKKTGTSVPVGLAALTTTGITAITTNSAKSGGTIANDGGAAVTARGICWSTSSNPTVSDSKTSDGTGSGSFTSSLTGLTATTTYNVRAYATNSVGTAYGNEVSFPTTSEQSVTICSQIWMPKNLDVSTYRNGDPIPKVSDNTAWAALTTGAYCYYNNDSATYAATYGKLYNWYAVNDPRGLAPAGWHVPSDAEWTTIETCLGGASVAGGAMKETGTTHWISPNSGATNSSGFAGLPGGVRNYDGRFEDVGGGGYWWSSTENNTSFAWDRDLSYANSGIGRYNDVKPGGFCVRCVRD